MSDSAENPKSPSHTRAWPRTLLFVGRVALGCIFIYAAFTKLYFNGGWHLGDYQLFFAMAIDSYKLLPIAAVEWMARVLPWFEMVIGAAMVIGVGLRWTSLLTSGLLLVFIGAMARAKLLGLEINCGCFGNNEKLGTVTIIRDSSLLILALAVTAGAFIIKKRRITASS
jgi:uncharacterized membrane protein YphA (DoxX/SURF4 family)